MFIQFISYKNFTNQLNTKTNIHFTFMKIFVHNPIQRDKKKIIIFSLSEDDLHLNKNWVKTRLSCSTIFA